jgi:hypothetical protein
MEVIIKKKNEVIRLENEIVISEIVFGWSMDDHTKDSKESSICQFRLFITRTSFKFDIFVFVMKSNFKTT